MCLLLRFWISIDWQWTCGRAHRRQCSSKTQHWYSLNQTRVSGVLNTKQSFWTSLVGWLTWLILWIGATVRTWTGRIRWRQGSEVKHIMRGSLFTSSYKPIRIFSIHLHKFHGIDNDSIFFIRKIPRLLRASLSGSQSGCRFRRRGQTSTLSSHWPSNQWLTV